MSFSVEVFANQGGSRGTYYAKMFFRYSSNLACGNSERGSVRSVYGGAYCGDIIILVPYDFYIIYGRAYSSSYVLLRIYYFTDYIRGSKKEGESKPNKRLANSG